MIDKKLEKTKKKIQEKVENAFTVSEYFKQLWEHPELKTDDKNVSSTNIIWVLMWDKLVIVSLETMQKEKKKMISNNTLQVSKVLFNDIFTDLRIEFFKYR